MNDLLQQFLNSTHGNEALQALKQQHGLSDTDAQHALSATTQAVEQHAGPDPSTMTNQLGAMGNAVLGGLGGMVGGGGLKGAVQGGLGGMVAGKAGQMIAQRTGMDPNVASTVAAAAMPFLMRFMQQRMGGQGAQQTPQSMPQSMPQSAPMPQAMNPNKAGMDPGDKTAVGGPQPAQGDASKSPWKRML